MQTPYLLFFSAVLVYVIKLYFDFRRQLKAIGNLPGYRTIFSATNPIANFSPPIPGVLPGRKYLSYSEHKDFDRLGYDIFTIVNILPQPSVSFNIADAEAIKHITSARARWPKPVELYSILRIFGGNIVASEDEEWKRHRKVANPAFSERNNRMVWEETVNIVNGMFDTAWKDKTIIEVDHCVDITMPLALLVIGRAGFGRSVSWENDQKIPPGHKMSFKEALHIVSTEIVWKVSVPEWAMRFTQKLRTIKLAFEEIQIYMQEMIDERRNAERKVERYDLFSSLLDASEEGEDGSTKLTDTELRGDVFIFMLAGHETTAHTLAFCFGMLALYQNEQEILYQHIMTILADGRQPTYEDMNLLTYCTAVFYETLRLIPPVIVVPKVSAEDTSLVFPSSAGERRVVIIPKGSHIALDITGLHYNPKYWKDPQEFRPKRFLEEYNRDAFLPFSSGARSCLGRRFFECEGIAILTKIVQKYKIEIMEEPRFAHETFDERRARILSRTNGITTTPTRVPLVFRRRN
ncbi:cytochrome P450 [Rickenella mellea]|uniref:Cytochrome P450 n=1 Tax=Rickenella mellea TaxID=50990 RepID=A0A4Y7Q5G0_9AGAM|nr:cytochrome P450 [Rickenella mellea]